MTEDVGTTPRKPLSDTGRLALWERRKGICCCCGHKIEAGDPWIDEHWRALGLGGSNDPENRDIAHVACAKAKTNGPNGDLAKIAKAKRVKKAHIGLKGKPTPLTGRDRAQINADKDARSAARGAKDMPIPRRSLYADAPPAPPAMLALPSPIKPS